MFTILCRFIVLQLPAYDYDGERCDSEVLGVGQEVHLPGVDNVTWRVSAVVHYSGAASAATNESTRLQGHFRTWRHHNDEYVCMDDLLNSKKSQFTGFVCDDPPFDDANFTARMLFLCRM